jgi:hypothetical protein
MSNPINNQIIDPVAAGATAHTSGFVEPKDTSSTSSAIPAASSSSSTAAPSTFSAAPAVTPATAILGSAGIPAQFGYMGGAFGVTNYSSGAGGLQSSPNVPAPGSSIDPSTGKPFSAGMTRAELEAKKAADLSGREQAARQLAGGLETPGRELPGGWGREYSLEAARSSADLIATPVVPAPGTSASAPASIYEVGLYTGGKGAGTDIPGRQPGLAQGRINRLCRSSRKFERGSIRQPRACRQGQAARWDAFLQQEQRCW